jgi:NADH-quinone oxidoreductase subunit M
VILAGVLLKMGTYGLIRVGVGVAPLGAAWAAPVLGVLAVIAILAGSLICLRQRDLKRLIAYSSVGHMGFVVLALATFTVGGVQGAVYASVAHGLITGLLFFVAGAIKDRYGTGDLVRLGRLYGRVPRAAGVFAFAALASLGLPGLAGFWGEMLAVRSAVYPADALPRTTYVVLAVIAAFGVILTSAYFLALLRSMLQAEPVEPLATTPDPEAVRDVRATEWVAWSPLLALTLLLGVAPGLLLTPVADAASAFLGGL